MTIKTEISKCRLVGGREPTGVTLAFDPVSKRPIARAFAEPDPDVVFNLPAKRLTVPEARRIVRTLASFLDALSERSPENGRGEDD